VSLRLQPSTVVEEDLGGGFVAGTTTGFRGAEWWGGLFLLVFLSFWAASLVPVIGMLASATGVGLPFLLAWLAIWIPCGALVSIILVWGTVGGRETVVVDSEALVLRQGIGRFALRRAYETSEASDFRVLTGETVFRNGYAVALTVSGKTVRFGNWPNRNEAAAVACALSARLGHLIARPPLHTGGVIDFRARPEWARNYFLLFWLIAWVAGGSGFLVSGNAFQGWQTAAFTTLWLSAAAIGATSVTRDILQHQRASAGPTGIEIQRFVGPLRWTRHYDRAAIWNLSAVPVITDDGPEEDRFELALELARRTVRFGIGLTRTEAQRAACELNERLYS